MVIETDEQYEKFISSLKNPERVYELLSEIQMVCLTDSTFQNHSDIDELKKKKQNIIDKIESKKIILDKAIGALKEIDKRYQFTHAQNASMINRLLKSLN